MYTASVSSGVPLSQSQISIVICDRYLLQENSLCEKTHSSRLIREVSRELIPLMTVLHVSAFS
jgi:hypothetical protein